jgi:hypothetical protein
LLNAKHTQSIEKAICRDPRPGVTGSNNGKLRVREFARATLLEYFVGKTAPRAAGFGSPAKAKLNALHAKRRVER